MRILLDARTIQDRFPGIGRYVYNLALALAPQLDGELLLLVNHATRNTKHAIRNTQYDLDPFTYHTNIQLIPTGIPVRHGREQMQLPRLIRSLSPDLVHFPYYVRPIRLGIPTILTLYDVIPRRFPAYFSTPSRLSIELLKRLAIRTSDRFVAISQTTSTDFQRLYGIPAGRITITPLAPDPIFQPQPPATIINLRQRLALPERYALYLGSNKPHKNLPRLIEAWARVVGNGRGAPSRSPRGQRSEIGSQKSEGATSNVQHTPRDASHAIPNIQYPVSGHGDESPTTNLVIAGAWDERYPESKQMVEGLKLSDFVRFLGPIDNTDLPALYAGADLFIFPSLYEGFGLPVLEAMACGTPVACSNTSSLPEVAGDAALYFDPTDVATMAAALQQLLGNQTLRRELSEKGRVQAMRFTWERTAGETLTAYKNALRAR